MVPTPVRSSAASTSAQTARKVDSAFPHLEIIRLKADRFVVSYAKCHFLQVLAQTTQRIPKAQLHWTEDVLNDLLAARIWCVVLQDLCTIRMIYCSGWPNSMVLWALTLSPFPPGAPCASFSLVIVKPRSHHATWQPVDLRESFDSQKMLTCVCHTKGCQTQNKEKELQNGSTSEKQCLALTFICFLGVSMWSWKYQYPLLWHMAKRNRSQLTTGCRLSDSRWTADQRRTGIDVLPRNVSRNMHVENSNMWVWKFVRVWLKIFWKFMVVMISPT
jgi:hypothetical protein